MGAGLCILWAQLFYACSTLWRESEYYSYGFYVPIATVFFLWRRWSESGEATRFASDGVAKVLLLGAAVLLPLLLVVRTIGTFDGTWRPPILLHAVVVVIFSHLVLWKAFGRAISLWFAPVTIFALSAVPYPFSFEAQMIRKMTGLVITTAVEAFNLFGRPVTAVGERLQSNGTFVEVTEGCSGIRSFQSLLMASLFYGEFFFLSVWKRVTLLAAGLFFAVAVNAGRAMHLATIRFDYGEVAFDEAHDMVGYVAFAIAAALLLATAVLLKNFSRRRLRSTGQEAL